MLAHTYTRQRRDEAFIEEHAEDKVQHVDEVRASVEGSEVFFVFFHGFYL